ncbi:MAG: hypothetical protein RR054_05785 [Clostridia bacterium]
MIVSKFIFIHSTQLCGRLNAEYFCTPVKKAPDCVSAYILNTVKRN